MKLNNFIEKYKMEMLFALLGLLSPISYMVSPILFICLIFVELWIVFSSKKIDINAKIVIGYLVCFTYTSVSVSIFKLYDLYLIILLPYILYLKKDLIFKLPKKYYIFSIIFLLYFGINVIIHPITKTTIIDYVRYIQCFILILAALLLLNKKSSLYQVVSFFKLIAIKSIISTLILGLFIYSNTLVLDSAIGLFKVNLFNASNEFRMSGFFTDPNKLSVFFIMLLAIYEFTLYLNKKIVMLDSTIILLIVPILLSMSRTGIITVIGYLILKFISTIILRNNNKNIAIFNLVMVIGLVLGLTLFSELILDIIDYAVYLITSLLGRDSTLEYSFSLTNDPRIISSTIALESVKDSLLVGNGLAYWSNIYYMPPHNTVVSLIQDSGLIGLSIALVPVIVAMFKAPLYIFITLILLPMLTLDLQNYRILYLVIAIFIMHGNFDCYSFIKGEKK